MIKHSLVGVAAAALAGLTACGGEEAASVEATSAAPVNSPSPNPFAGFRLADFSLTDHRGRPADEDMFDDEVTALTFFFTSCPGPCPIMIQRMKDVQERTSGTSLRFAAISVDGTRDTPEVLREYAARVGVDESRWTFLTGAPSLVGRLAQESLNFEIRVQQDYIIKGPGGVDMANILHPTRILLVGPDRTLLGVYPYGDANAIDRLVADARRLAG